MGTALVIHRDTAVSFKDWDLWALRSVLLGAADELTAAAPRDADVRAARRFVAGWFWLTVGVVSGTDLDAYPGAGPGTATALVRVTDRAIGRVRAFGRTIPAAYWDEVVRDPHDPTEPARVYGRPQSVRRIVRLLLRFRSLVALGIPDAEPRTETECDGE